MIWSCIAAAACSGSRRNQRIDHHVVALRQVDQLLDKRGGRQGCPIRELEHAPDADQHGVAAGIDDPGVEGIISLNHAARITGLADRHHFIHQSAQLLKIRIGDTLDSEFLSPAPRGQPAPDKGQSDPGLTCVLYTYR